MFENFLASMTDPNHAIGHVTYLLLIFSMLMRRMVWLRIFAVSSGSLDIVYRLFFVPDPVSVFWETLFVAVNLIQLALIWYDERHHGFTDDEHHFIRSMPVGVEKQALKRLVALAERRMPGPGAVLIEEGKPVDDVIYIVHGVAQVQSGDKLIAICRPGDYLGEMSFLTGAPASATVTAVEDMRVLAFNQARLNNAIENDLAIRRAVEAGLNRNLVGKLVRSNADKQAVPASA